MEIAAYEHLATFAQSPLASSNYRMFDAHEAELLVRINFDAQALKSACVFGGLNYELAETKLNKIAARDLEIQSHFGR